MNTVQQPRADRLPTEPPRSTDTGATGSIRWDGTADSFDDALTQTLTGLCAQRCDILAHAVRAPELRWPLRPLGVLCGATALEYADLGSVLYRLQPAGTGLTRAAVRQRRPVWVPFIAQEPAFASGSLLAHYGICSGAAFG